MLRMVVTGGPSAGKTSFTQALKKKYGSTVFIVPEAATLLYSSGAKRPQTSEEAVRFQHEIYRLQLELETQAIENAPPGSIICCDRGSIDGSVYWPGSLAEFCGQMQTTLDQELNRYDLVIHLQAAELGKGYQQTNIRTEDCSEAQRLDQSLCQNWGFHSKYFFISNQDCFEDKLALAFTHMEQHWEGNSFNPGLYSQPATINEALYSY